MNDSATISNNTPQKDKKSSPTKRVLQILGSTLLTGLLFYAVFSDQSFDSFIDTIAQVDRKLLYLYALLSILGIACRAQRYRVLLRDTAFKANKPPRYQMIVVTLIRNGLVDLLPARLGETSFLYVCNRYGFSLSSALSTFGVCLVLDVLVLFGLILTFIIFQLGFSLEATTLQVSPLAIGIILSIVLVLASVLYQLDVCIQFFSKICRKYLRPIFPKSLARFLDLLLDFGDTVQSEMREIKARGSYPILVLLTAGLRAAKYLSLYLLLLAVVAQFNIKPADISPLLSTTAFIGAEASASLPISGLMGFGAYEAAWSAIFSMSSVSIPSVAAVILAVHVITQVFGYSLAILGLLVFLIDEFRSRSSDKQTKKRLDQEQIRLKTA